MLSTLSSQPDVGEAFLRAAEATHRIGSPQQFFLWLRLHLHRFIPHELALLWVNGGRAGSQSVHVLNCVPLAEGLGAELAEPTDRLWEGLVRAWRATDESALGMPVDAPALLDQPLAQRLAAAGYRHVVASALPAAAPGSGPRSETLVAAFWSLKEAPAQQATLSKVALDLWMPYLQFALTRAHRPQAASAALRGGRNVRGELAAPATRQVLTSRELQVLSGVRQAQATAQIALTLGISPLTVKNHLRNIQKKLGARTRAHAVAEAMAMRLIT